MPVPSRVPLSLDTPIRLGPSLGVARLRRHLDLTAPQLPPDERQLIACSYVALGALTGVGDWLPYAQGVHETGFWSSPWWRRHRNPAGLGVTGQTSAARESPGDAWVQDGAIWRAGHRFASVPAGVLAQFAHLVAYAAPDDRLSPEERLLVQFSPRLSVLNQKRLRGEGATWGRLSGLWAPGGLYAHRIFVRARQIEEATR